MLSNSTFKNMIRIKEIKYIKLRRKVLGMRRRGRESGAIWEKCVFRREWWTDSVEKSAILAETLAGGLVSTWLHPSRSRITFFIDLWYGSGHLTSLQFTGRNLKSHQTCSKWLPTISLPLCLVFTIDGLREIAKIFIVCLIIMRRNTIQRVTEVILCLDVGLDLN